MMTVWMSLTLVAGASEPVVAGRAMSPRPGRPGIDHGQAAFVFHHVAVDMAEPRQVDGELAAKDPGCDLGDLGRCLFLLLFARARSLTRGVIACAMGVAVSVCCSLAAGRAGAHEDSPSGAEDTNMWRR